MKCSGVFFNTYLADELHVTVLDTVVDHLDIVASTLVANPLATSLAVALGGNALEDILDEWPGLLVATGHERGAISGTLLTTGNTGTDESEALALEVLGAAVGIREVGVSTIDDDVTLAEQRQKSLNPLIDGFASLDKQHNTARRLELVDKLLVVVSANDELVVLGLVGKEVINLANGSVIGADGVVVVGHVQNQILSPGQTPSAGRGRLRGRAGTQLT